MNKVTTVSVNEALIRTGSSNKGKSTTQNQRHPPLNSFLCDCWNEDRSFRSLLFTRTICFEFKMYMPSSIGEKTKFKKTMDLLDVSLNTDDLTILRNKESTPQQIFDVFQNLQSTALKNLSKWEGKSENEYRKGQQTNTYVSLGARVAKILKKFNVQTCNELVDKIKLSK